MRFLIAVASAVLVSFPALAAYDVVATMPATAGATTCQLVMDGQNVGGPRPCGSAQSYPGVIANPGTYAFAYRAVNASGESGLSPVTTVAIDVVPPPADPTTGPTISVACDPAPCPASITVVIKP